MIIHFWLIHSANATMPVFTVEEVSGVFVPHPAKVAIAANQTVRLISIFVLLCIIFLYKLIKY